MIIDEMVSQHPRHKLMRFRHGMGQIKVYGFHPKSEVIFVGTPRLVLNYNPNTKQVKILFLLSPGREIVCGQYKMYPSSCCPVILNGVLSSSSSRARSSRFRLFKFQYRHMPR